MEEQMIREHQKLKPYIKELADVVRETNGEGRVNFPVIAARTGINIVSSKQIFLPSCSIESFDQNKYRVVCMLLRTQMPAELYDFSTGHEFGHLLLEHFERRDNLGEEREEREAS